MKSPIIDRADLQSLQQRSVSGVLTLVFWMLWAYLWLPVLALIAWAVGLEHAYKYMVVLGGYEEVLRLVWIYSLVILLMCGTLYAWATYNIVRYSGTERRVENRGLSHEQIARYFLQGPLAVESWQTAQRLYVTHDEKGVIARVDILAPGAPVPGELQERENDTTAREAKGKITLQSSQTGPEHQ